MAQALAVQLLLRHAFPTERADLVVREALLGRTLLVALFGAIGLLWLQAPRLGAPGWIPATLFGLPCLLVAALLIPGLVRGWRGPRWVLRARREGLALNVRSCMNADLPSEDPTVAWIPAREVACLRPVREDRRAPDNDGGTRDERSEWLELRLTHADTGELERVLARERSRRGSGRTQHHAYPVEVPEPGLVRVLWRGPTMSLTPSLRRSLGRLGLLFPLEDPARLPERDWRELDEAGVEAQARELYAHGRTIDAVRLLRARRGWSTTRARGFLEEGDELEPAA